MKFTTNKGSAAIELVFIVPLVVLFLVTFFKFFKMTTDAQFRLIASQKEIEEELRKAQLSLPVLKQPCLGMHPFDWKELCKK